MPRGRKRNWFAVESSIIDNPKWLALGWDERGKWLAIRALAERQPTACFKDEAHLVTLLAKEGDPEPATTVARLVGARLLDRAEDGTVCVHDLEDYRPDTTSTERVRRFRERERSVSVRFETDETQETATAGPPPRTRARRAGAVRAGNGPKRTETATDIQTPSVHARQGGARVYGGGASLKDILNSDPRLPEFLRKASTTKETISDGETSGSEGGGDDDGESGHRPRHH